MDEFYSFFVVARASTAAATAVLGRACVSVGRGQGGEGHYRNRACAMTMRSEGSLVQREARVPTGIGSKEEAIDGD